MDSFWVLEKLWHQKVCQILKASPDIEYVIKNSYFIIVKYKSTGITEYWALNNDAYKKRTYRIIPFPKTNPLDLSKKPKIFTQFEVNPYYKDEYEVLKKHFLISKQSIKDSAFLNLRSFVHHLTAALFKQGWEDLLYTDTILRKDWADLNNDPDKHKLSINKFRIFKPGFKNGKRLLYHFGFLTDKLKPNWDSPTRLYTAINRLTTRNLDITRESIAGIFNVGLISPNYYKSIFNSCGIKGRVIDFYCTNGSKFLASTMNGFQYYHTRNDFDGRFSNLSNYIGSAPPKTDDGSVFDLAIIGNHRPIKRELAEKRINRYRHRAKELMLMIHKNDIGYFKNKYKHTIRIIFRISKGILEIFNDDNYLLIIGQR